MIQKDFGNNNNIKIDNYLKIIGWNCSSAWTPENKILINAHLDNLYTDIIILNDCGIIKKKRILKIINY